MGTARVTAALVGTVTDRDGGVGGNVRLQVRVGRISSARGMRQMQLGAKLIF